MNKEETPQTVVFGTFKGNQLIGFRCDTMGSLSKTWAKPYSYTKEQVDIIRSNVKAEMNHAGTEFMKALAGMNTHAININSGDQISMSSVVDRVLKQENELRELEEFEVRVLPMSVTREQWYELGEGDEWRKNQILEELESVEPLEVYKFKVTSN
jgi:hypothetical protein